MDTQTYEEMSTWEKRRDSFSELVEGEKSVCEIVREVSQKYGLTMCEMLAARRDKRAVLARQEAYYRCRRETLLSWPQIGRHFGNRDHSSCMKGAERHEARLAGKAGK